MRRYFSSLGLLFMALTLSLTSCLSDGDDTIVLEDGENTPGITPPPSDEDQTQVVSSGESATFDRLGFEITVPRGAVPYTENGSDGRVAFTVTDGGELPADLPDGAEAVDGASIKVEPMNFTFNSPIAIDVPLHGYDSGEVALLYYNESTGSWEVIPFSSVNGDGTATVSVIELGYFVLVRYAGEEMPFGGIHIDSDYLQAGYYYYLTLTSAETSGTGSVKRISFSANGSDLYMANIPFGSYYVTVSRERRDGLGSAVNATETYTETMYIDVVRALVAGRGGFSTYTGWVELQLDNYSWTQGRPDNAWGEPTATYGTGTFQATLTWVNTASNTTDYDLHLYGPNDLHVFFSHKNEGAFELDRDWISDLGNAVENIYTVNDEITPGEYQVKVHHYSGVLGKRYNCRVIMNGVLVKSVTGEISVNKEYDDIYTFTIE